MKDSKNQKLVNEFFIGIAVFSFIIAMIEGWYYYSNDYGDDKIIYFMLMLQNGIKAFTFKAAITLENAYVQIHTVTSVFGKIIGYLYCAIYFAAPYCTLVACYKIIDKLLRFRNLFSNWQIKEYVIIFGNNEYVKKILENVNEKTDKKRKVHLITMDEISEKEEYRLLKKNIRVHHFNCIGASEKDLKFYMNEMEAKKANYILLLEEKASLNFSLYYMFQSRFGTVLNENVKFFCACDDDGIKKLIENYIDQLIEGKKTKVFDVEIFDIHALQAQEMFRNHSLHTYYIEKEKEHIDLSEWKVHMLILGFGGLGQQILLETINQGVVHSENEIFIDVVDYQIEEKMGIFANHFSSDYADIKENEIVIPKEKADGHLHICFHQMDIRYKQFQKLLEKMGEMNPFTYITICMDDSSACVHCLHEITTYLKKQQEEHVAIGIRMDSDQQLTHYLTKWFGKDNNLFVIVNPQEVISLNRMIGENMDEEAKKYNYIYGSMNLMKENDSQNEQGNSEKNNNDEEDEKQILEAWKKAKLFQRDSSRALCLHQDVKKISIKHFNKKSEKAKDSKKCILHKQGGVWTYASEDDLLDELKNDPFLQEMAKVEHRRWCYYMSCHGWRYGKKKNEELKDNPCMCNWDSLAGDEEQKHKCKYDLMPLLAMLEMKEKQQSKKIKTKKHIH